MNEEIKLNMRVTHVLNTAKHGLVTAICIRQYGTNYAVTWEDLGERWHAAEELKQDAPPNPHMGFASVVPVK